MKSGYALSMQDLATLSALTFGAQAFVTLFVIELQFFSGLPLFLAILSIATYFQMAEFFRNKLVAGHAFHSVTKVAALGILHVHPLLEPRAVCVEGVLYLREYILLRYCGLTQPYFR